MKQIFEDIFAIGQGICTGTINFEADFKTGHPAEALDYIFTPRYDKLLQNKLTKADVESMIEDLEYFAEEFCIEEIELPVERLKERLNDMP